MFSVLQSVFPTPRFCANYLHSSIANSINTSPYKEEPTRRARSDSLRKGDKKTASSFLREMDIVNGFQLCDARYRSSVTKGTFHASLRRRRRDDCRVGVH